MKEADYSLTGWSAALDPRPDIRKARRPPMNLHRIGIDLG